MSDLPIFQLILQRDLMKIITCANTKINAVLKDKGLCDHHVRRAILKK